MNIPTHTRVDSLRSFASVTFRRLEYQRPFIFIHAVISFHLFHYRGTTASIETCSISDMTSHAHAKPLSCDSAECIEPTKMGDYWLALKNNESRPRSYVIHRVT
ncbi:hypothetical protein ALC57_06456 [Trachymyrmex cornetzi]|uniref:Uncharacterized protein n=1 Tax=Trachymyrmex cornetzi TaxID=471704 RepID=A0A151J8W0_9HYME|nr:hypothetical protein ALC57_06456 [Trachymyrmex cornetzi]